MTHPDQEARAAFEDKYRCSADDPSCADELAIWMAACEWQRRQSAGADSQEKEGR